MEELTKKIEEILNQFFLEEQNNRLSQFSMLALKQMLINEIKNYSFKEKGKDDKAISK